MGSQFVNSPPKLILELPHEFYEAIGCRTSSPQTDGAHQTAETEGGDKEQSELEEEREEEDEQEELSIGGSKVDIAVAKKALDRYGFGRLVVKRIRMDGTSARKFAWRKEPEDDGRNMDRAVLFVQAALSKTCSFEFAAVDVSRRSVVSQSKATPNKKTACRQTRTDIFLCPPDLSKEAQKNPRACLSEALGVIDLKKPENMMKMLRFNRGQGLSQYIVCTTTAGHEVPTMLTDLGGHTRIYHSAGDADDRHVEEWKRRWRS